MTKIKRAFIILAFLFVFALVILVPSVSASTAYAAESVEEGGETIVEEGEVVEGEAEQPRDWGDWIKNELIPYAILAITAISTIIIAVSPILAKVKTASERFKNATTDVNKTAEEGVANSQKIGAFIEQTEKRLSEICEDLISQMKEEGSANTKMIDEFREQTAKQLSDICESLVSQVDALGKRVAKIEKTSANTERITRIAFGNTKELVQKGYAAEIEKVGKSDEQREEETKP